jgi:hypothetical protein
MSKPQDSILNSVWVVYRGEKPKYTTDSKCWNNCQGGNLAQLCDGEGSPVEVTFFSSEKKAREEARKHDDAHVDKISIMVGYEAWWKHNADKQQRLIDMLGWAFLALAIVPLLTIIGFVLYEHTILVAQALICSGTGLYLIKKAR